MWEENRVRVGRFVRVLLFVLAAACCRGESIVGTKHDLSASGGGVVKAEKSGEICIFCHTSHSAGREAPLWNRYSSGAVYTPYSSSTAKSRPGQPTGNSKLCLSCHDGTVALAKLRNGPRKIRMEKGVERMPVGAANLGTDLRDDHPISFKYDLALAESSGELADPSTLGAAVTLEDGDVQCTSCHDVHNNRYGRFLVMDNESSALCVQCHRKQGWEPSAHNTSDATWNGAARDPWPHTDYTSVKANGCSNCHRSHGSGSSERLLLSDVEEENCLGCHNGKVADKDIRADLEKFSAHTVSKTKGVHQPGEDAVNPPRHVECEDCHNPHAAFSREARPPAAPGALAGVRGVDLSGRPIQVVRYEYEVCYRCHADSVKRGEALVWRVDRQTNTRLEFDPGNASYHPVVAKGRSASVPSLIHPLTESSLIYCTSCHNSDQGRSAGGNGPDGPHGSIHRPILERRLALTDGQHESDAVYALCYKCHDRRSILDDVSFPYHSLHVKDQKTACTTCHDPHGSRDNARMINFNTESVSPSSLGRLEFLSVGPGKGQCFLSCHDHDHAPESYGMAPAIEGAAAAAAKRKGRSK